MGAKKPIDCVKQNEVIDKLETIIFTDPDKKTVLLMDLDNNIEIQQRILELIPELRHAFIIHNTPSLVNANQMKRPWLSIIRHYLGKRYQIITKNSYVQNSKYTKKYFFIEKNIITETKC
jgi:hypothetical protein